VTIKESPKCALKSTLSPKYYLVPSGPGPLPIVSSAPHRRVRLQCQSLYSTLLPQAQIKDYNQLLDGIPPNTTATNVQSQTCCLCGHCLLPLFLSHWLLTTIVLCQAHGHGRLETSAAVTVAIDCCFAPILFFVLCGYHSKLLLHCSCSCSLLFSILFSR